jgi:hypothetical protein
MNKRPDPGRRRRSDTPASAAILAGLGIIFLAVYLTGSTGHSGASAGIDSRWTASRDVLPDQVGSLALTGTWVYGSDDLYEYINGQAPFYIQFGFQAVLVGEYGPAQAVMPTLIVDVYDQGERRNAYGLFMESFPPEEMPAELGNDGFVGYNTAAFWKGPFYVRVMALTAEDLSDQVEEAARLVAELIEDDHQVLVEFDAFPSVDLVTGTQTFSKTAAFGLPYLRDTFLASYRTETDSYRLFFCILEHEQEAADLVEEHAQFLEERQGLHTADRSNHHDLVWGEDRYIGAILMIREGRVLAGSTRLADPDRAEEVVRELINSLRREP